MQNVAGCSKSIIQSDNALQDSTEGSPGAQNGRCKSADDYSGLVPAKQQLLRLTPRLPYSSDR